MLRPTREHSHLLATADRGAARAVSGRRGFLHLSAGAWIIILIAVISTGAVAMWPVPRRTGLDMWTSARAHSVMYRPVIAQWNKTQSPPVNLYLLSSEALARRMMSGFLSHTPLADIIEVERSDIGRAFAGPIDDVGFVDLTDRVHRDGLYDQMNQPSFSPWTSRGHIFGLPHDVHPVMLAYRADIVEAAGIDMSKIKTWDEFDRVMLPLTRQLDRDGKPKHYPLNIWYSAVDQVETLVLQAGGGYFDRDGRPTIDSDINTKVIATIISWMVGPDRIAADAPEFDASGNELRLQGYVVCSLMPDWLTGVWKLDLPQLAGKVKLMPLPAWTSGGRRTSVWGGTMLGIPKTADIDKVWPFARQLYFNKSIAQKLFETNGIISPVKSMWKSSFYDVPDPYFRGQAPGRMYIGLAPLVPWRTSSPYYMLAKERVQDALSNLRDYAIANHAYQPAELLPEAKRQLHHAQEMVENQLNHNVFLSHPKEQP
jgi:arabinosaccharide transport system substrate-binding protein